MKRDLEDRPESMRTTPEQREKMAQAFYNAAQDKKLPATKRLEARFQAKRWRALAKWARERLGHLPKTPPE